MAIRIPELNEVLLTGRLTRDADVRMTQRGQSVCGFSIAVNRRYLDNASGEWKDEVAYVTVSLFGSAADRAKDKLRKGVPILVEGRLVMNEFTDKSGQNRRELRVNARRVQFFQSADELAQGESSVSESQEAADVAEDDVPF